MTLGFDAGPEEIKVFLEEAEEQIQLMEEDLVALEEGDGDAQELLGEIFRAAHTLKGSSAALGHRAMAQLTHEMENLLDQVRKDRISATPGVIDLLLSCLDLLRGFCQEIAQDQELGIESAPMLRRIQGFLPGQEDQPTGGSKVALEITFTPDAPMKSVRAYQLLAMELPSLGSVLGSTPSLEEIEADQVGSILQVQLETDADPTTVELAIRGVGDIHSVEIRPLGVAKSPVAKAQPPVHELIAAAAEEEPMEEGPVLEEVRSEERSKIKSNGSSIRVDVELLDDLMNLVGELVIDRTRLTALLEKMNTAEDRDKILESLGQTSAHIGRMTGQLQEQIMKARMLPLETLFRKFPRMVRDLARKAKKDVDLTITGKETELDRSVIEQISDPLIHLLRNAIGHGLESPAERALVGKNPQGKVEISAQYEESYIVISLKDDGRGIDPRRVGATAVKRGLISPEQAEVLTMDQAIDLIFSAGFSTADQVNEVSGRGVGLDIVKKNIEKLNGTIQISSNLGKGTEFRVELPLTLAIIRTLLVESMGGLFAIPLGSVMEAIRVTPDKLHWVNRRPVITVRGNVLPLASLGELLEGEETQIPPEGCFVVVVKVLKQQFGIVVDTLVGEEEVVIKNLSRLLGDLRGLSGAAILGQGDVALILDIPTLVGQTDRQVG